MPGLGPDFITSTEKTSDLIRETLVHAQGSNRQAMNILDVDSTVDRLTLRYPISGVQPGQRVEVGWTEYVVVEVDTTSKELTVLPEIPGTAMVHPAETTVTLRPRYTSRRVITEMNNELKQLTAKGIYRIVTVDANDDGTVTLPDGVLVVLEAWRDVNFEQRLPAAHYEVSDSPLGPVLMGPDTLLRVTLGCALNPLPLDADVLVAATTGLFPMALDILPMGAALRLLTGTESQRNIIDHQGDTRRAEEVPTGGPTTALRNVAALRQERINEEAARIQNRYGYQYHVGL